MNFKAKNVLVIGIGKSGMAAAEILKKYGAKVTVCDIKEPDQLQEQIKSLSNQKIKVIAGKYPEVSRTEYDLLVMSPGVPLEIEPVLKAREENIPIIGEVELAYQIKNDNVQLYAITGTNGKTTTTTLLQHILANGGVDAFSGGNIGNPLCTLIDKLDTGVIVVETSSFQLDTTIDFRPNICGIINITPDHLDRHKTMQAYIDAKAKIFANQDKDNYTVLNYEDKVVRNLASRCPAKVLFFSTDRILEEGAFIKNNKIMVVTDEVNTEICEVSDILLRGKHNLENVLCASMMAILAGIDSKSIRQTLMTFTGVRHRLEKVTEHKGVLYINDSKATNPESAIKALESFTEPIILIAGGKNKGCDFTEFAQVVNKTVKEIVLVGAAKVEIKSAVMATGFSNIHEVDGFEEAVVLANRMAVKGDVVLLAPACTSWDMFDNYEQRGDLFCDTVNSIIKTD